MPEQSRAEQRRCLKLAVIAARVADPSVIVSNPGSFPVSENRIKHNHYPIKPKTLEI